MIKSDPGRGAGHLVCRLLWHRWTGWRPVPGGCDRRRDCPRCDARESFTVHDWGKAWTYDRDGACEGHLACTRCDAQQPDIRHAEELAYDEPHPCDARFTCTRCGAASDPVYRLHRYQWQYDAPGRCAGGNRCARCGDAKAQTERHDYDWLVAATEQACRAGTCRRCAGTVTQVHDYRWAYEPAEPLAPPKPGTFGALVAERHSRSPRSSCFQRYECANCGRAEPGQRREAHNWHETISSDEHYRECYRCSTRAHWPYRT